MSARKPSNLLDLDEVKHGQRLYDRYRALCEAAEGVDRRHDGTSEERIAAWTTADDVLTKEWAEWAHMHAGAIMDALRAYAALEYILDRTGIDDLRYWGTPGCFSLEASDFPDWQYQEDSPEEPKWDAGTLHELLCEVAADFAKDEDEEPEEPEEPEPPKAPSSEELGYADDDAVTRMDHVERGEQS